MAKGCFGVDVGGTTVKIGYFDSEADLVHKWEIPTRKENHGAYILSDIAEALKAEMKARDLGPEDILGVGMGIPGPVTGNGVVNRCVNLGWPVFEVEKAFSELFFGLPMKAGNDANVAALGEAWYGGGKDYTSLVMITLGTGVGGGVIIDRTIVNGFAGAAGEIGHIKIYPYAKKKCTCGNIGCLEQIGSATGISNRAKELMEDTEIPSALRGKENITAKDVLDLHGRDELADRVIEDMVETMGRAMNAISCVIDPEAFLIGGGVSKAGSWLMEALDERFHAYAFHACRRTHVVGAELGNDAGIYGAQALVRQITQ